MPDGSTRSSLKDCRLEVGSSMIFEYTDKKEPQFVNTKPRKKVHEALTIPVPLPDPASTPTSVDAHVAEINFTKTTIPNKYDGFDPLTAALLGVAIVTALAIAVVASFTNAKASKIKKLAKSKIDRFDQIQKKKKEEQGKCNSKSDNLKSFINEVDLIIEHSVIQEIEIKQNNQIAQKIKDLNKEMTDTYRKLNKLEDELTKVKTKKTTYTKRR